MELTRRRAIALFAAATLKPRLAVAQSPALPLTPGPFVGTTESLKSYRAPTWFGEAKFGIWSHWGPQSGIEAGDWYARNMYVQGSDSYNYHVETYGHPTQVGYKDLIPKFKGDRWDPEHLMDLYQKAGAKYFFSMGVHHDNFDMWNSKYHPRWNAVATGPKTDIVGRYAAAARKRGLRFGVSEHLSNSFDWFTTAHTSDKTGPWAGKPYDGNLRVYSDLYHDISAEPADFAKTAEAMGRVAPDSWKREYFMRVKDLVDQHQPDLLYTDGGIPFESYGLSTVAELYNVSAKRNGGKVDAIYFTKETSDLAQGGVAQLDRERGVLDSISPEPWQTDTCIGDWHYHRGVRYKTAKKVIDLLVDIVSKNGNLLLNFPLPNSGELDPLERVTLDGITQWMAVNSEGIYATKPWTTFGEGPSTRPTDNSKNGHDFNEGKKPDMGVEDIRYTTKGSTLFAFVQGWPTSNEAALTLLGAGKGNVQSVSLLGGASNLKFTQDAGGLRVKLPEQRPETADIGITLKIGT